MIEITRDAVMPVPAERAWALLRDFNAMPEWNATIKSSRIEDGPADRIGCRRVLVFDDGSTWTHALTGLSEQEMVIAYAIVGVPAATRIPMRNYQAVIRVEPMGDDRCRVTWHATLESDREAAVRERAGAVFEAGLAGLKRRLTR